jgi:hypothetical protein
VPALWACDYKSTQFGITPLPAAQAAVAVQYAIGTFSTVILLAGVTGLDLTSLFAFSGLFASAPTVTMNGTSMLVGFTPVPEPTTVLGLATAG